MYVIYFIINIVSNIQHNVYFGGDTHLYASLVIKLLTLQKNFLENLVLGFSNKLL